MAAYSKKQGGGMSEEEKKALVAKRLEEKKAELAAKKKQEIEELKVKIKAAAAKGDKAEVERLIALVKGGNK